MLKTDPSSDFRGPTLKRDVQETCSSHGSQTIGSLWERSAEHQHPPLSTHQWDANGKPIVPILLLEVERPTLSSLLLPGQEAGA